MAIQTQWTVSQHGGLIALAENLWTVEGTIQMPPGPLPRRMTIARLENGDLIIFSAIALAAPEMAELEALGRPAFLVVPNPFHRQDAPAWKARYPDIVVVAPHGAKSAVAEHLPVEDTTGAFSDPSITFETVAGTNDSESALVVSSANGITLVLNDLIGNVQNARGLMKLVLWAMGFAGKQPQVPRIYAKRAITDKAAVSRQLQQWATLPKLQRILVSHGAIIDHDPAHVLLSIAKDIA